MRPGWGANRTPYLNDFRYRKRPWFDSTCLVWGWDWAPRMDSNVGLSQLQKKSTAFSLSVGIHAHEQVTAADRIGINVSDT